MKNQLKEKIKNHQKIIGTHINFNDVAIAQIAGAAGYDFVWIDMEHSNLSLENLLAHIIAVKAGGASVIVRVPQDDLTFTKKVLEMGPDGIIFPMIKTAQEADTMIASTLYPPYGTRGFGPMNAIRYGLDDVMEYVGNTVEELCRFIQIEHIEAVENLDEIMQNEFIDGYIFGPNDLSGSIHELCRVYDDSTITLIKRCVAALRAKDKYIGLSTGEMLETVFARWHELGIDMLSAGSDFSFLQRAMLENRILLEKIHKNN